MSVKDKVLAGHYKARYQRPSIQRPQRPPVSAHPVELEAYRMVYAAYVAACAQAKKNYDDNRAHLEDEFRHDLQLEIETLHLMVFPHTVAERVFDLAVATCGQASRATVVDFAHQLAITVAKYRYQSPTKAVDADVSLEVDE